MSSVIILSYCIPEDEDSNFYIEGMTTTVDANQTNGTQTGTSTGNDTTTTTTTSVIGTPLLFNYVGYAGADYSVEFDLEEVDDTTKVVTNYEWDFDGDGTYDYNTPTKVETTHSYSTAGDYTAFLRVTYDDSTDELFSTSVSIADPATNPGARRTVWTNYASTT